jgi:ribonuclease HI
VDKPHVYLFTDGSCTGTGVGAWCSLVVSPGYTAAPQCGIASYTTINRCELQPIIDGLRWIKQEFSQKQTGIRVAVISDSETIIRTIGGANEASSNLDLWFAYREAARGLRIMPTWRERNSHPYMTYADTVCSALRKLVLEHIKYITEVEVPNHNLSLEGLI